MGQRSDVVNRIDDASHVAGRRHGQVVDPTAILLQQSFQRRQIDHAQCRGHAGQREVNDLPGVSAMRQVVGVMLHQ